MHRRRRARSRTKRGSVRRHSLGAGTPRSCAQSPLARVPRGSRCRLRVGAAAPGRRAPGRREGDRDRATGPRRLPEEAARPATPAGWSCSPHRRHRDRASDRGRGPRSARPTTTRARRGAPACGASGRTCLSLDLCAPSAGGTNDGGRMSTRKGRRVRGGHGRAQASRLHPPWAAGRRSVPWPGPLGFPRTG